MKKSMGEMLELNRLYNMDCMEGMKEFPDNYFELAIVDPPYGIGASSIKKYSTAVFTKYIPKKWDNERPAKHYFDELFRVSKEQIIFGGNYFTGFLPPVKNWIVWDKLQPEGISFSMHELIFYSGKGQAKIYRGHNGANRCTVKHLAKKYIRIHPTQKPIALYDWLLKMYAKPGDKILDTHVGSTSSLIACRNAGHEFIGFELDKDYYEAATKRMEAAMELKKAAEETSG